MADATAKVVIGGSIAHVSSGASIAAAGFSSTGDIATELTGSSNLSSYPRCDVILKYVPGSTTATTAMTVPLYRQDLNLGANSSLDMNVPGTNNSSKYVGTFQIPASVSTGTYYADVLDVQLPGGNQDCRFFIYNALTNTIPAGWALTVVPKSDVGATS